MEVLRYSLLRCGTSFMSVLRQGVPYVNGGDTLPLFSFSPMAKTFDGGEYDADEATEFDVVTHLRHLEDVCSSTTISLCMIGSAAADNCCVNKRQARLLHVPHVGFLFHKMNLDVNFMLKSNVVLDKMI